jgi:hypothetical protein
MPPGYRHSAHLDESGDWVRVVGRLFWLRRRCRYVIGVDMAASQRDSNVGVVLRVDEDGTRTIVDLRKVS